MWSILIIISLGIAWVCLPERERIIVLDFYKSVINQIKEWINSL